MKKGKIEILSRNEFGLVVKHATKAEKEDALEVLNGKVRRVRASGAKGKCKTEAFLKMLGKRGEVDPQSQRRFDVGSIMEPVVAQWMRNDGCDVDHNSDDSVGIIIPVRGGIITGHHDVIYSHPLGTNGKRTLGDIKTMNDRSYKSWCNKGTKEDKPTYYAQVSIYAPVLGLEYGAIIGTNKNSQELSSDFFPIDLEYRRKLISEIEQNIAMEDFFMDPNGGRKVYFGRKTLCDYCSQRTSCDQAMTDMERGFTWSNPVPRLKKKEYITDLLANLFDLYENGKKLSPGRTLDEILEYPEQKKKANDLDGPLDWNDVEML